MLEAKEGTRTPALKTLQARREPAECLPKSKAAVGQSHSPTIPTLIAQASGTATLQQGPDHRLELTLPA